jgi:hypothetical protein
MRGSRQPVLASSSRVLRKPVCAQPRLEQRQHPATPENAILPRLPSATFDGRTALVPRFGSAFRISTAPSSEGRRNPPARPFYPRYSICLDVRRPGMEFRVVVLERSRFEAFDHFKNFGAQAATTRVLQRPAVNLEFWLTRLFFAVLERNDRPQTDPPKMRPAYELARPRGRRTKPLRPRSRRKRRLNTAAAPRSRKRTIHTRQGLPGVPARIARTIPRCPVHGAPNRSAIANPRGARPPAASLDRAACEEAGALDALKQKGEEATVETSLGVFEQARKRPVHPCCGRKTRMGCRARCRLQPRRRQPLPEACPGAPPRSVLRVQEFPPGRRRARERQPTIRGMRRHRLPQTENKRGALRQLVVADGLSNSKASVVESKPLAYSAFDAGSRDASVRLANPVDVATRCSRTAMLHTRAKR